MNGFAELNLILAPKGLRDDDARADADAREQVDDGRGQEYAGPDRRRSLRAQKIADKEDVDSGIKLLDQAGPQQGQLAPSRGSANISSFLAIGPLVKSSVLANIISYNLHFTFSGSVWVWIWSCGA